MIFLSFGETGLFNGTIRGQSLGDRFSLNPGEDYMIAVGDDDGARSSPHGRIDQFIGLFGILLEAFHRRRSGRDNSHDAVRQHGIAKADIEEFFVHRATPFVKFPLTQFNCREAAVHWKMIQEKGFRRLLDVLHLLSQLADFAFHPHDILNDF